MEADIAAICDRRFPVSPSPTVLLAITIALAASSSFAQQGVDDAVRDEMVSEYRATLQSLDQLRVQNNYLEKLVDNQRSAKSAVAQQLENYRRTKPEIIPLMTRMIESLDEFVDLDLPFDLESRRARLIKLTDVMAMPEITTVEKLRRILDAYQIEMTYGRDIDATVGWLEANGPRREVTFLRVGRLVLAYQTHDRAETGFFNPTTRRWELLPDRYRSVVAEGLRVAKKQAAPVLLRLPVAAPEAVK